MSGQLRITPREWYENGSQYAYRILYHNIMRMQLLPGEKINESEMTRNLGISSTPFRQALFRLREEGLVDIRSQRSTTVSFIDFQTLRECIFIRCTLEGGVVEQLCREGLPPKYEALLRENLKIQGLFAEDPEARERFFELDNEFHSLLFEAAGKKWTFASIGRVCAQLDRVRYINAFSNQTENHAGAPFFYEDHRAILASILARDPSPMVQRMVRHVNGGSEQEIRFPPEIQQYIVNP